MCHTSFKAVDSPVEGSSWGVSQSPDSILKRNSQVKPRAAISPLGSSTQEDSAHKFKNGFDKTKLGNDENHE
jgi:hypothetical protein